MDVDTTDFPGGVTGGAIRNQGMWDFLITPKTRYVIFSSSAPVTMSFTSEITDSISFSSSLTDCVCEFGV
jgi:hypothetical protein